MRRMLPEAQTVFCRRWLRAQAELSGPDLQKKDTYLDRVLLSLSLSSERRWCSMQVERAIGLRAVMPVMVNDCNLASAHSKV